MVKMCVPTMGWAGLDEEVSEHFGRAPTFTIVELETSKVEVTPNTGRHMGVGPLPAELLKDRGIDVLICLGMGPRAASLLNSFGIKVYYGSFRTVREAVEAFKTGGLQEYSSGISTCPKDRGF